MDLRKYLIHKTVVHKLFDHSITSGKDTLTRKEEYFELVLHFLGFSLTFPT